MGRILGCVIVAAALGACSLGQRIDMGGRTTPDGYWALGGHLIRTYEAMPISRAYEALTRTAKDMGWTIEDRDLDSFDAEIEAEAADGTDIELNIWAPAGKPMQVGVQFDRGDARIQSKQFFEKWEARTAARRLPDKR